MKLTELQYDALKEVINIGIGKSASILNTIVNHHVELQAPRLKVVDLNEEMNNQTIGIHSDDILSSVQIRFQGNFTGVAALVLPPSSAVNLVNIVTDNSGEDFNSIKIGTLTEIGNILINGLMGTIGNILKEHIDYTIPSYIEDKIHPLIKNISDSVSSNSIFLLAEVHFAVKSMKVEGNFLLIFEIPSIEKLVSSLTKGME